FIFLAFGFAPRRREVAIEPVAMPAAEVAKPVQADANTMQADANDVQADAKHSQAIATVMQAAAKQPATGTRAYYLARLDREFPEIAKRVHAGELSVFRGCIEAGIRKAPAKGAKWTKPDSYAPTANIEA